MLSPIIAQAEAISCEAFADLYEDSDVLGSLDLGNVIIHKCIHPQLGEIHLISKFSGDFGVYQSPSCS
jgi:hypothetical protein